MPNGYDPCTFCNSSVSTLYVISLSSFVPTELLYFLSMMPLYRLAKSRDGLALLFSSYISIALYLPLFMLVASSGVMFAHTAVVDDFVQNFFRAAVWLIIYFHSMVIGINRFHCVAFPFSYANFWTKRITFLAVILSWLIPTMYQVAIYYFNFTYVQKTLPIAVSSLLRWTSAFFYLLMIVKVVHEKYFSKIELTFDASLKDRIRIGLICSTSMASILFRDGYLYGISKIFPGIPPNSDLYNFIINFCTNTFMVIEPVCLCLLCKEFRRNFVYQFYWLICCEKYAKKLHETKWATTAITISMNPTVHVIPANPHLLRGR